MAFEYAYSTNGSDVLPAKNFKLASAYTNPTKGDVVKLNASQELVKAVAADTEVLGVLESTVFEGIGKAPVFGQVKIYEGAVYRTPFTGSPVVGSGYAINASQVLNGGASGIYKVVDIKGSVAYVQISATTFE